MPGVKNPMCNTFPRWIMIMTHMSGSEERIISESPPVTTGVGALVADKRTSTQSAFWDSIILTIRW